MRSKLYFNYSKMKKIIFGTALLFACAANAQQPVMTKEQAEYCADLRDGMVVLTEQEQEVEEDILLRDSSVISRGGTLTRKNGAKLTLQRGECVDQDGNIYLSPPRKQKQQLKTKKVK